jgi:ATP/ADP translocase
MGLLAVIWLLAGLLNIYYLVFRPGTIEPSALVIASMISSIVFSVLFFTGVEGLARRKKYGRWIAVAGLSLICAGGVLSSFARFGRYRSPGEGLSALIAGLVIFGLVGFLVYRLARGAPANAFFSGTPDAVIEDTEEEKENLQG